MINIRKIKISIQVVTAYNTEPMARSRLIIAIFISVNNYVAYIYIIMLIVSACIINKNLWYSNLEYITFTIHCKCRDLIVLKVFKKYQSLSGKYHCFIENLQFTRICCL